MGYVEFIGEGVFDQLTHETLEAFIKPENAGKLADGNNSFQTNGGQRRVGNRLGTSLWSWVMPTGVDTDYGYSGSFIPGQQGFNAFTNFVNRTASDVDNALSGTAFITPIGKSHGLAYNAEAIVNFRTDNFQHRVSNYVDYTPIFPDTNRTGVILHHENAAAHTGHHAYVYGYAENGGWYDNAFESRISFNNTWGPTLADGDDYNSTDVEYGTLSRLRIVGVNDDSFDNTFSVPNSLAEVEEAIRKSKPYGAAVGIGTTPNDSSPNQLFTGFYFDNATFDKACEGNKREGSTSCSTATLGSWYAGFFPTKFFYAEDGLLWKGDDKPECEGTNVTNKLLGDKGYLEAAVIHSLALAKPFDIQVWDITEKPAGLDCSHSPCVLEINFPLGHELSVFSIKDLKNRFGQAGEHQNWDAGRVVLKTESAANVCRNMFSQHGDCIATFPGLLYTFDIGSDGYFSHWRALAR
jgi:hypothetical protein